MPTAPYHLKYPTVLVHGLGARSTYGPFEYFHGLPKILRDDGNHVLIVSLASWENIENRALQLKKQIERAVPTGKVNILGHSMGGLDARYLVSRLGFEERVASVTSIGTPNLGTPIADIAAYLLPKPPLVNAAAFKQLTRTYCRDEFNHNTPNVRDVGYFSATTAIRSPTMANSLPIFWLPHKIVEKEEGDNDGFVSVESAKWGEHICTYAGDHYAQIGQFLGRTRGMDYLRFYREIIRRLKKEGM